MPGVSPDSTARPSPGRRQPRHHSAQDFHLTHPHCTAQTTMITTNRRVCCTEVRRTCSESSCWAQPVTRRLGLPAARRTAPADAPSSRTTLHRTEAGEGCLIPGEAEREGGQGRCGGVCVCGGQGSLSAWTERVGAGKVGGARGGAERVG
eukprot:2760923-Rhodomonas_salina.1